MGGPENQRSRFLYPVMPVNMEVAKKMAETLCCSSQTISEAGEACQGCGRVALW